MAQHDELVTAEEPKGPPLPKWAYGVVNPLMSALLRSPLHRLLSGSLMILIFEGRKSGRRYQIPVGYLREGEQLTLFSHSAWAKNFVGGAPVAMRLQGRLRRGTARVTDDREMILKAVRRMIAERGEQMAERMGFVASTPAGERQPRIPRDTTFIVIDLEP